MFNWLSNKVEQWARPANDASFALYQTVATAARNGDFYQRFLVDDGLDGRFDTLTLNAVLVVRRLSAIPDNAGEERAQGLIDTMFADLDLGLHEIGVSENKVGNKVKTMAKAYLGRMTAYDTSIAANDRAALALALERNLYRDNGENALENGLVDAVLAADQALSGIADADLDAATVGEALSHLSSPRVDG